MCASEWPELHSTKWADEKVAAEVFAEMNHKVKGTFATCLAEMCGLKSNSPPSLDRFTDSKMAPNVTKEEI